MTKRITRPKLGYCKACKTSHLRDAWPHPKKVIAVGEAYCAICKTTHPREAWPHGRPAATRGEARRFLLDAFVYEGDDCLIWPFNRDDKGYATTKWKGRSARAYRVVCEAAHGAPPTDEHEAAHSCGKGHLGCIAKGHLRWATHLENHGDRIEHGTNNRGESNGNALLNEFSVRRIRELMKEGSRSDDVGAQFGVSRATVNAIVRGENWSWVA